MRPGGSKLWVTGRGREEGGQRRWRSGGGEVKVAAMGAVKMSRGGKRNRKEAEEQRSAAGTRRTEQADG